MKTKLLCVVALVAALAMPSIAQANLLNNAGFETWVMYGAEEVPADWWHMFSDPDITGTKESTIVKNGSYSGKTQATGSGWGGWGQWLTNSVNTGDVFEADVYVNIPSSMADSEAVLEVAFKDASEQLIGNAFTATRNTATSGWEMLSLTTDAAPSNAAYVSYVVLMRDTGASPSGTVYFDNACGDLVPEPNTLLLLGSGLVGLMGFVKRKRN